MFGMAIELDCARQRERLAFALPAGIMIQPAHVVAVASSLTLRDEPPPHEVEAAGMIAQASKPGLAPASLRLVGLGSCAPLAERAVTSPDWPASPYLAGVVVGVSESIQCSRRRPSAVMRSGSRRVLVSREMPW
jgi:hypothetical protein